MRIFGFATVTAGLLVSATLAGCGVGSNEGTKDVEVEADLFRVTRAYTRYSEKAGRRVHFDVRQVSAPMRLAELDDERLRDLVDQFSGDDHLLPLRGTRDGLRPEAFVGDAGRGRRFARELREVLSAIRDGRTPPKGDAEFALIALRETAVADGEVLLAPEPLDESPRHDVERLRVSLLDVDVTLDTPAGVDRRRHHALSFQLGDEAPRTLDPVVRGLDGLGAGGVHQGRSDRPLAEDGLRAGAAEASDPLIPGGSGPKLDPARGRDLGAFLRAAPIDVPGQGAHDGSVTVIGGVPLRLTWTLGPDGCADASQHLNHTVEMCMQNLYGWITDGWVGRTCTTATANVNFHLDCRPATLATHPELEPKFCEAASASGGPHDNNATAAATSAGLWIGKLYIHATSDYPVGVNGNLAGSQVVTIPTTVTVVDAAGRPTGQTVEHALRVGNPRINPIGALKASRDTIGYDQWHAKFGGAQGPDDQDLIGFSNEPSESQALVPNPAHRSVGSADDQYVAQAWLTGLVYCGQIQPTPTLQSTSETAPPPPGP